MNFLYVLSFASACLYASDLSSQEVEEISEQCPDFILEDDAFIICPKLDDISRRLGEFGTDVLKHNKNEAHLNDDTKEDSFFDSARRLLIASEDGADDLMPEDSVVLSKLIASEDGADDLMPEESVVLSNMIPEEVPRRRLFDMNKDNLIFVMKIIMSVYDSEDSARDNALAAFINFFGRDYDYYSVVYDDCSGFGCHTVMYSGSDVTAAHVFRYHDKNMIAMASKKTSNGCWKFASYDLWELKANMAAAQARDPERAVEVAYKMRDQLSNQGISSYAIGVIRFGNTARGQPCSDSGKCFWENVKYDGHSSSVFGMLTC